MKMGNGSILVEWSSARLLQFPIFIALKAVLFDFYGVSPVKKFDLPESHFKGQKYYSNLIRLYLNCIHPVYLKIKKKWEKRKRFEAFTFSKVLSNLWGSGSSKKYLRNINFKSEIHSKKITKCIFVIRKYGNLAVKNGIEVLEIGKSSYPKISSDVIVLYDR